MKAKRIILSLVAATMVATGMQAQSTVLATLSHDGNVSVFYGADALKEAMDAADHGDVITLSSGVFQTANITKAVTLRGAGIETDTVNNTKPTVLSGWPFSITVPDSQSQSLTMEGIYTNYKFYVDADLKNATFWKCRFSTIIADSAVSMQHVRFVDCKITSDFIDTNADNIVTFSNCLVTNPQLGASGLSNNFELNNCVIRWTGKYDSDIYCPGASHYAIYRNCIMYHNTGVSYSSSQYIHATKWRLNSTNAVYNCLGIGGKTIYYNGNDNARAASYLFSALSGIASNSYYTSSEPKSVFKTFTGTYKDTEKFDLTDTAKASYLGDDGKEVGLYGGSLPFTTIMVGPRIDTVTVGDKTTEDGKLNVQLTVKTTTTE